MLFTFTWISNGDTREIEYDKLINDTDEYIKLYDLLERETVSSRMFAGPHSGMGDTKCIVWIACTVTMANKTTYLEWTLSWTHLLTGFYIQFFCCCSHLNAVYCQIFIINNFISDCHFRCGRDNRKVESAETMFRRAHALEILINGQQRVPSQKNGWRL